MKFKSKLKENLKDKLNELELSELPGGFQSLENLIILKLHKNLLDKKELIAEACMTILPNIKSIYLNTGKISGDFREPERIEYLVGEANPIVEHRENNIIYRFDITKIMFSKGNLNERKYLSTLIRNKEIVIDMFAGIGYFSLPIGKNSPVEKIFSIELNPEAYKYFIENIKLNKLENKIIPILGDSKVEVKKLSDQGIKADRVIMGVFPAPKNFIKAALTVAKEEGTIYHYEGVVDKENYMDLFNDFCEEAKGYQCKLLSKRFVKSYGPNLYHVVVDIEVLKT